MAGTAQGEGRDASQSRPITVQGHPAAKGLRIPSSLLCWQENPFYSISIDQSCFTTALAPVLPARTGEGQAPGAAGRCPPDLAPGRESPGHTAKSQGVLE